MLCCLKAFNCMSKVWTKSLSPYFTIFLLTLTLLTLTHCVCPSPNRQSNNYYFYHLICIAHPVCLVLWLTYPHYYHCLSNQFFNCMQHEITSQCLSLTVGLKKPWLILLYLHSPSLGFGFRKGRKQLNRFPISLATALPMQLSKSSSSM